LRIFPAANERPALENNDLDCNFKEANKKLIIVYNKENLLEDLEKY
jgi:hypothetical protein